MIDRRAELVEITEKFVSAFNQMNIDNVVKAFAEDGIYEDSMGGRHVGHDAIRTAFEPLVGGAKGKIRFDGEDFFAEVETGKVLISWYLNMGLEVEDQSELSVVRGIDVLHFNDDNTLAKKMAYMKVDKPHIENT